MLGFLICLHFLIQVNYADVVVLISYNDPPVITICEIIDCCRRLDTCLNVHRNLCSLYLSYFKLRLPWPWNVPDPQYPHIRDGYDLVLILQGYGLGELVVWTAYLCLINAFSSTGVFKCVPELHLTVFRNQGQEPLIKSHESDCLR